MNATDNNDVGQGLTCNSPHTMLLVRIGLYQRDKGSIPIQQVEDTCKVKFFWQINWLTVYILQAKAWEFDGTALNNIEIGLKKKFLVNRSVKYSHIQIQIIQLLVPWNGDPLQLLEPNLQF